MTQEKPSATQIRNEFRPVTLRKRNGLMTYYIPEVEAQDIALGERESPSIAYSLFRTSWGYSVREISGSKTLRTLGNSIVCRGPPEAVPTDSTARYDRAGDEMSELQEIAYRAMEDSS